MKQLRKILVALLVAAMLVSSLTVAFAASKVKMTGTAYLRSGPGLDYSIKTSIPKGKSVSYQNSTKKDDRGVAWYKVTYNGKTGWVSSKYASLNGSSSGSSTSGTKVKATGNVNIRSAAGTGYKSMGILPKGKTATYLGESKKDSRGVRWYYIKYSGKTGWVSSKYAKLV